MAFINRSKFRPITALLGLGVASLLLVSACGSSSSSTHTAAEKRYDTVNLMTGLRYIEYEKGTGPEVRPGMTVQVDYAGYLTDGTLFDTSMEEVGRQHDRSGRPLAAPSQQFFNRGGYPFQPLEFQVGQGMVIQGWDEGLTTNMRVGGRRRLIIPPQQAYGSRQQGTIPPNSTLIFDVKVLSAR